MQDIIDAIDREEPISRERILKEIETERYISEENMVQN